MCNLLEVSRSGYYDWVDRPSSQREIKHDRILKEIKRIHKKHPVWGVDPIWAEVKEIIPCSRNTIYSIMKKNGIKSKRKAKWKATTNSNHNLAVAPNLLEQNFDIKVSNTAWVGDINSFRTREGAKQAIFEYIEVYYNRQRRHAALGWITPATFKKMWFSNLAA